MYSRATHANTQWIDFAFSNLLSYSLAITPGYEVSRHIRLLSQALMAVEQGKIKRLIICEPPRHGKTMMASNNFPAWYLGRNPGNQIIFTTFSGDKALDEGTKVRNQLSDPVFDQVFSSTKLSKDRKGSKIFTTTEGGIYAAVGIGGAVTGRGADLFIIDDPVKDQEQADSALYRRKIQDWFRAVAYTRLQKNAAIIIIMTRWHYDDLVGWLLREKKHEGWVVLSLPAIANSEKDLLKRHPGEALWPEFFPLEVLGNIKQTVGTRVWNAMYQQTPIGDEGGLCDLDWFKRFDRDQYLELVDDAKNKRKKKLRFVVHSWDTAFKEAQINDPSSCTVWGEDKKASYLLDRVNKRLAYPDLVKKVVSMAEKFPPDRILIEDKGSGQSLIQDLKSKTRLPIIAVQPEANKVTRFQSVTNLIEAGKVYLPEAGIAPWLVDYETELAQFPLGPHDDDVDSTSQYLADRKRPKFKRRGYRYWK
jgi:predicted phage terminase large subunit-like protein